MRLMHVDRILLGEEAVWWDANPHGDDPDPTARQRIDLTTPL